MKIKAVTRIMEGKADDIFYRVEYDLNGEIKMNVLRVSFTMYNDLAVPTMGGIDPKFHELLAQNKEIRQELFRETHKIEEDLLKETKKNAKAIAKQFITGL